MSYLRTSTHTALLLLNIASKGRLNSLQFIQMPYYSTMTTSNHGFGGFIIHRPMHGLAQNLEEIIVKKI